MSSHSWSKSSIEEDLRELSSSKVRMMDEPGRKELLFTAIRVSDLSAIRTILQVDRGLIQGKMFGYEGSDVYEVIKDSKTKRCYTYTGQEKDGYFYALHVAAEAGHKNLTLLFAKAGADIDAVDYRGSKAEEKCNGNAMFAFYELNGLKFESSERYQGKVDREGKRCSQGVLFYKPEGYEMQEMQLYRGTFKNDLYHGHGTLYWPGTETVQYIGRFKDGLRHGRGLYFDERGCKQYHGMFKEDQREGRGIEFSDSGEFICYKGEFCRNQRHGFGVAYYPEKSKFFGRFEMGAMSGIGIYAHPNGDRFEGTFFNNKPDGLGSFYAYDINSKSVTCTNAVWQAGRKSKESSLPFVPTLADLPDYEDQQGVSQRIRDTLRDGSEEGSDANVSREEDASDEDSEEVPERSSTVDSMVEILDDRSIRHLLEKHSHSSKAASKQEKDRYSARYDVNSSRGLDAQGYPLKKTFAYFNFPGTMDGISKQDMWKISLGKYLRLPLKEAVFMGLILPSEMLRIKPDPQKAWENHDVPDEEEAPLDADEEEADESSEELRGYHFMSSTALLTSYVYVTSAAKVFEERLVSNDLKAEFTDFETVYHLIIDAVDSYNEKWEQACKEEEERKISQLQSSKDAGHVVQEKDTLELKRQRFMTEKEKKEQLILKQRAELAVKRGVAELSSDIEGDIEQDVLGHLVVELSKLLLPDDLDAIVGPYKEIASYSGAVISKNRPIGIKESIVYKQPSGIDLGSKSTSWDGAVVNKSANETTSISNDRAVYETPQKKVHNNHSPRHSNNQMSSSPGNKSPRSAEVAPKNAKLSNSNSSSLTIDDLFELYIIDPSSSGRDTTHSAAMFTGSDVASEHSYGSSSEVSEDEVVESNEFAAELLYLLQAADNCS